MHLQIFLAAVCVVVPVVTSAPIIDCPWGRVLGKDVSSPSGAPYYAYQGVPFALPPVGPRRWTKPQAHPGPGEGRVFNATSLGYICPQTEGEILPEFPAQSEDCLTLNVYVPSSPSNGLRSVMVWIYGGGFFLGSAAGYKPSKLVTEGDVIVVAIQYRIGILGFLSSGDEIARGNYGLFDQALAMQWVKDNIAAFGGDPDTITLFGESAGAGSIGFHLLSPYSKDLFLRGVQQSGTPLSSWAVNKKPDVFFGKLAERTGCWKDSPSSWLDRMMSWRGSSAARTTGGRSSYERAKEHERMLTCFRGLPVEKLLEYTVWLTDEGEFDVFSSTPWTPVVDHDFVPRPPQDMLSDARYLLTIGALDKAVMLGVNNNEGGYVLDFVLPATSPSPADVDKANEVFTAFASFTALDESVEDRVIEAELKYRYPELEKDKRRLDTLTKVANFFYLKPKTDKQADIQAIADTFADIYFTFGAVQMAKDLAAARLKYPQASRGSVYLYLFNHFPASKAGQVLQGVNHAEDMYYQFDATALFPQDEFNADDFAVQQNFVTMLVDFAKNGNSNTALGGQLGGDWPEFSLTDESYLSLSAQPRVEKQMYGKRIALWLDLLPSLVNSTRPVAHNNGGRPFLGNMGGTFQQTWYFKFTGTMNRLWR